LIIAEAELKRTATKLTDGFVENRERAKGKVRKKRKLDNKSYNKITIMTHQAVPL